MPTQATPEQVGQVVQQLDNDQQKHEAAVAAAATVPNEATAEFVGQVVQQLDNDQQKQKAATAALAAVSPTGQAEVAANAGVLDLPDKMTQRRLWYMVVGTMAVAIFVFGVMAFL
jgi:hypothetical protein